MKRSIYLICLLSCTVILTVGGWYFSASHSSSTRHGGKRIAITSRQTDTVFDPVNDDTQDRKFGLNANVHKLPEALAQMPLPALLAEYELSGDDRYLESARSRFKNDPSVQIFAALAADSPAAEAIANLERTQPDNAVPNLLRAGMHASNKDWEKMREQINAAFSKEKLSLNSRERMANVLDLIISEPRRLSSTSLSFQANGRFNDQVESIVRALTGFPLEFGGSESAANLGIALAEKLRSTGENNYTWSRSMANGIESLMLIGLDPTARYRETEISIEQRVMQLNNEGKKTRKLGELYSSLFSSSMDSPTRAQFFFRMRADGEMAALNWLMQQSSDL